MATDLTTILYHVRKCFSHMLSKQFNKSHYIFDMKKREHFSNDSHGIWRLSCTAWFWPIHNLIFPTISKIQMTNLIWMYVHVMQLKTQLTAQTSYWSELSCGCLFSILLAAVHNSTAVTTQDNTGAALRNARLISYPKAELNAFSSLSTST